MLWTIALVLFILWLFGVITGNIFEGAVHLLLVLALILIVMNLFQRART